jgi:hypothetical protein
MRTPKIVPSGPRAALHAMGRCRECGKTVERMQPYRIVGCGSVRHVACDPKVEGQP